MKSWPPPIRKSATGPTCSTAWSPSPAISNRLTVDVYRLKLANNLLKKPSEYVEMAQLVLQAKAPAEALKVIDKGYKAGVLGVGAERPATSA